ncbi:deaminase [Streptomyces carminius]|uniref:Deaminase n=1 Tax=Streptomyces carminius TaxID=2665496 RepID=A0A2M8M5G9_9ACTN|nr:dihydrofolate reductase family protein [Streptomyces carminius]PJE99462.1 deaminase [Streptomyces carminius]
MTARPYVLLTWAMSLDGYLDDASDERLILSSPQDAERVDAERATVDAILVGATTVRRDNPRLMVRSPEARAARVARGLPPTPAKVTISAGGDLDPSVPFFTTGETEKFVYTADAALDKARERLSGVARVCGAGDPVALPAVLADLHARGVRRLMVEGGGSVHTQFLEQGLADEAQVCVAPFLVGDGAAPRFVGDGVFPFGPGRRMRLAEVSRYGDCAYLRYALTDRFRE